MNSRSTQRNNLLFSLPLIIAGGVSLRLSFLIEKDAAAAAVLLVGVIMVIMGIVLLIRSFFSEA